MFVLLLRTRRVLVSASPCTSGFATVLRRTLDLDLDVCLNFGPGLELWITVT
jgi:hypothetical protein